MNEVKNNIDKILRAYSSESIIEFVKDYAEKDSEFASIFIRELLPNSNNVDTGKLSSEIQQCFVHPQTDREMNTNLDWFLIIDDLVFVIERMALMIDQGLIDAAMDASIMILDILGEKYMSDEVYQEDKYDDIHYSIYGFTELLTLLLQSNKSTEYKRREFHEKLKLFSAMDPYNSYLPILP